MDGDGDIDCPYDFDDKTGVKTGGSSGSSASSKTDAVYNATPFWNAPTHNTVEAASNETEVKIVPTWVYWVISGLLFLTIYLYYSRNRAIKDMESRHKAEIRAIKDSCTQEIAKHVAASKELEVLQSEINHAKAEKHNLTSLLALEYSSLEKAQSQRRQLRKAPLDVTFAKDGMPIFWKTDPEKPYGDYTVYIGDKANVYHVKRYCSSYHSRTDHIFNVIEHARPCKKCAEGFFSFDSVPNWYEAQKPFSPTRIYDNPSVKINYRE